MRSQRLAYVMPAEWQRHDCCWMLLPYRADNWRSIVSTSSSKFIPAVRAFIDVAKAISRFENVRLGVHPTIHQHLLSSPVPAANHLSGREALEAACLEEALDKYDNLSIFPISYDDSWMRDIGPTFLLPAQNRTVSTEDEASTIAGVNWGFNAWGKKVSSWDQDDAVACSVMEQLHFEKHYVHRIDAVDLDRGHRFILEGGSIHSDGEGTVLTTEECLLNSNRNPHLSKEQIEQLLLYYLGARKVLWLKRGLAGDVDTDGHIDNICCFSRPGQVLLAWSDDATDEQYAICREAMDILRNSTDAAGRTLNVVKLPVPPVMRFTAEECAGLMPVNAPASSNSNLQGEGGYIRSVGERLAASYVNFYIANGGIICPAFSSAAEGTIHERQVAAADTEALRILRDTFPDREVVQVAGCREILLGGGNIHCITQQQPLVIAKD